VRDHLLRLIKADFPALDIRTSRLATNGWDNDVVIVNEEYVFRFATEPHTPLDVEMAVLNRLRDKTTLAIPHVEFIGRSATYMGYRMIRGSQLTTPIYRALSASQRTMLARDLARFLVEVHRALSVQDAVSLGVRHENARSYLEEAMTVVHRIDDQNARSFVETTLRECEEIVAASGIESFLYNDLHGDNVGFDVERGCLNGVYDFGDIAIGDIHREFGPLYRLDKELLEATVACYEQMTGVSLSLRRIVMIQRLDRLADLAMLFGDTGNPEVQKVFEEINEWRNELDIYAQT